MARKSAQTCDPAVEQEFEKGKAYEQEQAHEKAFACFSAAWRGNAAAQYALGQCYADGRGIGRDEKSAYEWFRLSAENGLAAAQHRVRDRHGKEFSGRRTVVPCGG